MYEPTLPVTMPLQSARPQSADISLIRAALFGAIAPPLLGTATFMLLMMENWTALPSPFFLLFMFRLSASLRVLLQGCLLRGG